MERGFGGLGRSAAARRWHRRRRWPEGLPSTEGTKASLPLRQRLQVVGGRGEAFEGNRSDAIRRLPDYSGQEEVATICPHFSDYMHCALHMIPFAFAIAMLRKGFLCNRVELDSSLPPLGEEPIHLVYQWMERLSFSAYHPTVPMPLPPARPTPLTPIIPVPWVVPEIMIHGIK